MCQEKHIQSIIFELNEVITAERDVLPNQYHQTSAEVPVLLKEQLDF
jgi:hypothetical protein